MLIVWYWWQANCWYVASLIHLSLVFYYFFFICILGWPSSTANLPPEADHVVIQLNSIKMHWRKPTAVQHRFSNLGNNCTRLIVVAKLLQVGSIPFWTAMHLRPATEEKKEEGWCHDNFSVLQLYHLWTWICCRHWNLLTHENSQALTAHSSTRQETPTICVWQNCLYFIVHCMLKVNVMICCVMYISWAEC